MLYKNAALVSNKPQPVAVFLPSPNTLSVAVLAVKFACSVLERQYRHSDSKFTLQKLLDMNRKFNRELESPGNKFNTQR